MCVLKEMEGLDVCLAQQTKSQAGSVGCQTIVEQHIKISQWVIAHLLGHDAMPCVAP